MKDIITLLLIVIVVLKVVNLSAPQPLDIILLIIAIIWAVVSVMSYIRERRKQ